VKPQSAKQKGRALQTWIAQRIIAISSGLTQRDVKGASSGANGADVLLSEEAFKQFPYSIEAKNRKTMKTLYDAYFQAAGHGNGEPLLIVKTDRQKPLAVVDCDHFLELVKFKRERT